MHPSFCVHEPSDPPLFSIVLKSASLESSSASLLEDETPTRLLTLSWHCYLCSSCHLSLEFFGELDSAALYFELLSVKPTDFVLLSAYEDPTVKSEVCIILYFD